MIQQAILAAIFAAGLLSFCGLVGCRDGRPETPKVVRIKIHRDYYESLTDKDRAEMAELQRVLTEKGY